VKNILSKPFNSNFSMANFDEWNKKCASVFQHRVHMEMLHDDEETIIMQRALKKRKTEPIRGGSYPGKKPNIDRQVTEGALRLYNDYFSEDPTYPESYFRRRFRMQRSLFLNILEEVCAFDGFFRENCDAAKKKGASPKQKMTAALRMLAYGSPADSLDEYLRMSESQILKCLRRFCKAVIMVFGEEHLRKPTPEDLINITRVNEKRGFPGMIGSIDCMHWQWKNCPTRLAGQFKGKEKTRP
jgi:hypothetical protein